MPRRQPQDFSNQIKFATEADLQADLDAHDLVAKVIEETFDKTPEQIIAIVLEICHRADPESRLGIIRDALIRQGINFCIEAVMRGNAEAKAAEDRYHKATRKPKPASRFTPFEPRTRR